MADQGMAKYRISVIAGMLGIHPQTIRIYEKLGLIKPLRSKGNSRLFSDQDVLLIERIQILTQQMGVNLAGVEIIIRMRDQIETMQTEAHELLASIRANLADLDAEKRQKIEAIMDACILLKGLENSGELSGVRDRNES